jgi:hypothetical protein
MTKLARLVVWYRAAQPGESDVAASRLQTNLGDRTKALCANIVVFYASLYFASGHLLPTGGLESVWFLSGLALWFLALLSAPWFVPPKDALANALTAMAILVTLDLSSVGDLKLHLGVVRWVAARMSAREYAPAACECGACLSLPGSQYSASSFPDWRIRRMLERA